MGSVRSSWMRSGRCACLAKGMCLRWRCWRYCVQWGTKVGFRSNGKRNGIRNWLNQRWRFHSMRPNSANISLCFSNHLYCLLYKGVHTMPATFLLSAFGDEIDADLPTQLEVLASEGVTALELR